MNNKNLPVLIHNLPLDSDLCQRYRYIICTAVGGEVWYYGADNNFEAVEEICNMNPARFYIDLKGNETDA